MIREDVLEEYIPRGRKTKLKVDDCFTGIMAMLDIYSFKIIKGSQHHLCLKGKNNEPCFMLLNISDLIIDGEELLLYYGKDGKYISLRAEPT